MVESNQPRELENTNIEAPDASISVGDVDVDMTSGLEAGANQTFDTDFNQGEDGSFNFSTENLYKSADSITEKPSGGVTEDLNQLSFDSTGEQLFDSPLVNRDQPDAGAGNESADLARKSPEDNSKIDDGVVEVKAPLDDSAEEAASLSDNDRFDKYKEGKQGANDLLYWSGKQAQEGKLFGEKGNLSKEDLNTLIKENNNLSPKEKRALNHLQENFDKIASLNDDGDGVSHDDIKQYFRDSRKEGNVAVNSDNFLHAKVNPEHVEEGKTKWVTDENGKTSLEPGILQFGSKEDIQKFQQWMDKKIPPDGTEATNDKRTALILKLAMQDASMSTDDPGEQMAKAYQKLNGMRHAMRELTPDEGYSGDPGIANAEHFLETAHRVGGTPFDGHTDDISDNFLKGEWSAKPWEVISKTYNGLKEMGVIGGSKAGGQHKWELSGINYGVQAHKVKEHMESL